MSIIKFIYKIKIQQNIFPDNENSLKKCIEIWDSLEDKIINKEYEDINNQNKKILLQYCLDENNKDSLLQIFNEEIYDNLKTEIIPNENVANLQSTQINSINQNSNNDLNRSNYNTNIDNNNYDGQNDLFNNTSNNQETQRHVSSATNENMQSENQEKKLKESDYNIINDITCLNNYDINKKKDKKKLSITIEYIKVLSNDLIIFGGLNRKVNIYNNKFEELLSLEKISNDREDWIYSIFEIKRNQNENLIKIGFCCIKYLYLCNFTYNNCIKLNMKQKILDSPVLFCLNINKNENDYLVFNDKGINKYYELVSKIVIKKNDNIHVGKVRGGIWIDDDIIAFISINNLFNKNQNYKKNKLNFYNINTKTLIKEIDIDFSFNLSQNNLAIMQLKDDEEKKILLCACKKYIKGQKNGIIIVNYNFKNGKEIIKINFVKTGNFEVYCFCPISSYKKENESDIVHETNYRIEKTNYFLVGGFNVKKCKGVIKLYQLINTDEELKIEFITEINLITFENKNNKIIETFENKTFRGPISSIIQIKKTGQILIGCWDGHVYASRSSVNIDNIEPIIINRKQYDLNNCFFDEKKNHFC